MVASMTGFARATGGGSGVTWTWEARSVNGRGLEVRCRLPAGLESLEDVARTRAGGRFGRGNISLTLTVVRSGGGTRLRINQAVLDQLLRLVAELDGRVKAAPARLDGLLAIRGVVEAVEEEETPEERERHEAMMVETLNTALGDLDTARHAEGARLSPILLEQLDEIERLAVAASATAATQPEAIRARLKAQVEALVGADPALPVDRLAQEAAVLAAKVDVREELDRLKAHTEAAHALLRESGPIGRRFDFLCQEFNREANTLCSKSADSDLTRVGLALKATIDRLREQVQNIE